jgi:hypothetical protein
MTLGIPKPRKRDRPNLKRRREIKRNDKKFQQHPEEARCLVPNCPNKPGRHHRIKRRRLEYRFDPRWAADLCWIPHHREIEIIGEEAFCEKYKITLPALPPQFQ